MKLKNKKYLVIGLGKTGIATAHFLKRRGAMVTAIDSDKKQEHNSEVQSLVDLDIRVEIGEHTAESFAEVDGIILSPGVPHTLALVNESRKKGTPVIGEIELASRFIEEPIVAVTGTNGKTTTTTLLGEMLTHCGRNVFVGGNIGTPMIEYADSFEKADIVVAEISSFQLDTIESFRPTIGVLLNIADDHLDRYDDFTAYARSKCRLFENQKESDIAVINGSDPAIQSVCTDVPGQKWIFSHAAPMHLNDIENSAEISETGIRFTRNKKSYGTLEIGSIKLPGAHNLENIAAASLATLSAGGSLEGIQAAIRSFNGLPHRLEHVATINGVKYFNDSKATNAHAVEKALETFTDPVVLIMCGRNKDVDFHGLEKSVQTHVKKLIVFGEAASDIQAALGSVTETERTVSMDEAVEKARSSAIPGDIVMLSPACSSFDMYTNYVERGNDYRAAVHRATREEDNEKIYHT